MHINADNNNNLFFILGLFRSVFQMTNMTYVIYSSLAQIEEFFYEGTVHAWEKSKPLVEEARKLQDMHN
jgi:hypothetical protein